MDVDKGWTLTALSESAASQDTSGRVFCTPGMVRVRRVSSNNTLEVKCVDMEACASSADTVARICGDRDDSTGYRTYGCIKCSAASVCTSDINKCGTPCP